MPCDPVHPAANPADQHDEPVETLRAPSPEAGFSLVEVLVVLLIIGLISTVVLINVLPARDRASVDKARADIAILEQALENYRLDNMTYPRTADGLDALVTPPASLTRADRYRDGGYIRRLPDDPWGNPYQYAFPGKARPFDIYSMGADGAVGGEGLDADIGNWE
jgi:general secretion pathway protein G